ncbi:MAG: hypothetical protein FWG66_01045 [Spirochaetes bacterium]|nr:hypothetical protein [Spirochaetota bacterium]
MSFKNQSIFWGDRSPLGGLCGISLLVMASGRLAWAVSVALSLFFVYVLSVTLFVFLASPMCKKFFPEAGRAHIFTCLCYLFGGVYLLLLWLISPLAAMEVFFPVLLVPLFCGESGILSRCLPQEDERDCRGVPTGPGLAVVLRGAFAKSAGEAWVLALLLVLVSLVREPLAYFSLSFPSPSAGMVTVFSFNYGLLFPMRIFASSAGALLLLGYLAGAYQQIKRKILPGGGIE